ncbi:MAG: phosphate ABC transporter permease subunit PstC [Gemmatimonadetes bacterium]|nr:phosphate ABC transporter permease subunit PstC [Gemmatimonadota bacterium]
MAGAQAGGLDPGGSRLGGSRRRRNLEERAVVWLLRGAALVSVVTTLAILVTLFRESLTFFIEIPVWDFITGTTWTPLLKPQSFGVLPLVAGTLLVAAIAGVVALGLGLASAVFLSEYAPDRARRIIKPALEVLAGVPTVVYGYFALTFLTPVLQKVFPGMIVFNALSAGLVMGLMIMPMVSTLSEDAMVAVPRSLRDAAYALGASRFEVSVRVVIPAALSGIVASFILALSRAVGETMIVTIAAGATPKLTLNPLESIQAMTAYIVQVSLGETPQGSLEYRTIFAVGLLLFMMTLAMNVVGRWVVRRFAERY